MHAAWLPRSKGQLKWQNRRLGRDRVMGRNHWTSRRQVRRFSNDPRFYDIEHIVGDQISVVRRVLWDRQVVCAVRRQPALKTALQRKQEHLHLSGLVHLVG